MKPAIPAVVQLLADWSPLADIQIADLYTFSLKGGETLRYSGFQTALMAPPPNTDPAFGVDLYPLGPRFKRTKTKVQIGTQVDELEIEILVGENDSLGLNGGPLTWQYGAWAGIFDGAEMALDRAYIEAGTVVGTINWFTGRVGDIEIGRTKLMMRVKSLLDLLTVQMPHRLFSASCNFHFGDAMCLFDRTTMRAEVVALFGSDRTQIATGLSPSPSTLYDNGTITGTSGANNGYSRTISRLVSGTVYFLSPWIFPVSEGDQFTLLPGCDKTLNTCTNTFGNQAHFGGFPYIPPPETAI